MRAHDEYDGGVPPNQKKLKMDNNSAYALKVSLQNMVGFVDGVEKYLDVATSHGFKTLEHQIRDGLWSLGKVLSVSEPSDVENILRYAGGPFYGLPYSFTKLTQK